MSPVSRSSKCPMDLRIIRVVKIESVSEIPSKAIFSSLDTQCDADLYITYLIDYNYLPTENQPFAGDFRSFSVPIWEKRAILAALENFVFSEIARPLLSASRSRAVMPNKRLTISQETMDACFR